MGLPEHKELVRRFNDYSLKKDLDDSAAFLKVKELQEKVEFHSKQIEMLEKMLVDFGSGHFRIKDGKVLKPKRHPMLKFTNQATGAIEPMIVVDKQGNVIYE